MADAAEKIDFAQGVALDDIPADGVLPVELEGQPWLLARLAGGEDRIVAVGATCTHLRGPLAQGLRTGDAVRCPWHHACFSLLTGAAVQAPAFDPLPRREVRVEGGRAYPGERIAPGPNAGAASAPRIVVIGAGAAGFAAVERLKARGHGGALHWLDGEGAAPYDRTKLSKDYLSGKADATEPAIQAAVMDGVSPRKVKVRSIDRRAREVELEGGERVGYDALLLAPGAEPRRPDLPGFDSTAVYVLRSLADADALVAAAKNARRAVVVGGGFIAMEAAASLRQRDLEVVVVTPESAPLVSKLGEALAGWVQALHESKGVRFRLGREARAYADGVLQLDDGTRLEAELVVVGAGVEPRLELAEAAGLARDGAVPVDAQMRSPEDGAVWAAGDVAAFPGGSGGARIRVEHWVVAERQGQIAAEAMLGGDARWEEAPFFWSAHYGKNIRYVGHADKWDAVEIDGDVQAGDAEVRYLVDGREAAVATVGRDLAALEAAERLRNR